MLEFEKEKEQQQEVVTGEQLELVSEEPVVAPPTIGDENDEDIEVPVEDQQLDLFGEETTAEQKPSTIKSSSTTKKKASTKAAAPITTKVGTDFTVFYAGHKIPVPSDDMTLEEVRQHLEYDFPELSKERAEMTIKAEKFEIVPVVKGGKKG